MEVTQETLTILKKKFNLCDKTLKPDALVGNLAVFGIPSTCSSPKKSTFCFSVTKPLLKISDSTMKVFKMMIRRKQIEMKVKMNVTYDTGNSCFESIFKITQ